MLLCVSLSSHGRQSCDWPFRTAVTITENSGNNLSDYQVKLSLTGSNLHANYLWTNTGYDFRVYDSNDNTPLEFWLESWNQSSKTATIWVRFPTSAPLLANQSRTIYLYYGNENATPLANVPFTFVEPGIKFHARPTSYNPSNKTQAFTNFNSIADNNNNADGYGCAFITNFDNVSKKSVFGNGDNFAAYSESYFEVKSGEAGLWEFRYGADFGRGGGLYVNDVALEEDWNNDLWWNYSWSNADVLQGSINLGVGYHKLEVIGFEGCCDGGITVQFKKPGGSWTTFNTSAIDIRSRACPVTTPSVAFGAHNVCSLVDLQIRNSGLSIPSNWETNVSQNISFQVRNTNAGTSTSSTSVRAEVRVPSGFIYNSASGNNWSCSQSGTTITCLYGLSMARNTNSSVLTVNVTPNSSASVGSGSIAIEVFPTYYDVDRSNNLVTQAISLTNNNAIAPITPTCTTPQPGIWSRFFNIQGYTDNSLDNAAEMQALVDTRANASYVDGQGVLADINGNANPYDDRSDEYYLTLLQGYLNVPTTGNYRFGVDGDDAVEFRLNNTVVSAYYGLHAVSGNWVNPQTVRLAAGYHAIEFRMQEYTGQAAFILHWDPPFSAQTIVPSNYFYHCAGNADVQLDTQLTVINDPINGTTRPKAIPGAVIEYELTSQNIGNISPDRDTTVLTQSVGENNDLFVGDLSGMGPVTFIDGTSPNASGLSYNYLTLASTTDGLSFSNDGGSSFTYIPTPDADGFDSQITHLRIALTGTYKPALSTSVPAFRLIYRVRLN